MDAGSEDAFYENLTLGIIQVLENISGVHSVELEKKSPCDRMQLTTWEQRNCCNLPSDLRQFYLSADGFKLLWKFEHAGETLPVGDMRINPISELKRLGGMKCQGDSDSPSLLDVELNNSKEDYNKPHFGVKCKIFEMDSCQGNGRVCLVYLDKNETDIERREKPKIWLLDRSFEWHFLADTFTQYFRMMLVHLGIPQWQFRFTPMGLTPHTEVHYINFFLTRGDSPTQMMIIIAPHLLQSSTSTTSEWPPTNIAPFNHVDPSIFRKNRVKSCKKKEIKSCME